MCPVCFIEILFVGVHQGFSHAVLGRSPSPGPAVGATEPPSRRPPPACREATAAAVPANRTNMVVGNAPARKS